MVLTGIFEGGKQTWIHSCCQSGWWWNVTGVRWLGSTFLSGRWSVEVLSCSTFLPFFLSSPPWSEPKVTRRLLTRSTFWEPAGCLSITPRPGGAFYPGRRAFGSGYGHTSLPPSRTRVREGEREREKRRKTQWHLVTTGSQSQPRWLVVRPSSSSTTSDDANRDRTLSLGMDGATMLLIWSLQGNTTTERNCKNKIKKKEKEKKPFVTFIQMRMGDKRCGRGRRQEAGGHPPKLIDKYYSKDKPTSACCIYYLQSASN